MPSVQGPVGVGADAPQLSTAADAPLLPEPMLPPQEDALAGLFRAMSALQSARTERAQTTVERTQAQREAAREANAKALREAQEAAERGGLLDFIAKDTGIIGVAAICTCQWALAAADVALHKSGVLENLRVDLGDAAVLATGRLDLLAADVVVRKLELGPDEARELLRDVGLGDHLPGLSDADVEPIAKEVIEVALLVMATTSSVLTAGSTAALVLAVAGAALSLGGSVVAKTRALGEESKWVGLGAQVTGALLTGGSGFVGGAAKAATHAKAAATITGATSQAVRGGETMVLAVNKSAAEHATLDAEVARADMKRLDRVIEEWIDLIKDQQSETRRTREQHTKLNQTIGDTHMIAATAMRG